MRLIAGALATSTIFLAGACTAPAPPTSPQLRDSGPLIVIYAPVCVPSGVEVHCRVDLYERGVGVYEATSLVTWIVSGQTHIEPTDIADFVAPGILRPRRAGDVAIFVRYGDTGAVGATPVFAVSPTEPPASLAFALHVEVAGKIEGALVEVLDGPDAGKRVMTFSNGAAALPFMRPGVDFTLRASKAGYVPVTKTHRIVSANDSNSTSVKFELKPAGS